MSFYSTVHLAKGALFASQTGIQVAANNIANADTPGYVRERLILTPAPPQHLGDLTLGSGVHVEGVVRQVDSYLQERLRGAVSDLAYGETHEKILVELESAIGEMSDSDLSTALSDFFNSVQDVLNQPEDPAVRHLAVMRGEALTDTIRRLDTRVRDLRAMANDRVEQAARDINALVGEIAKLNQQIMQVERGGTLRSDAVGLRDKRDKALEDLARLVNIQVREQDSGAVNVFVGGDYLVFDSAQQLVKIGEQTDRGLQAVELRMALSDSPLAASSGETAALLGARDDILAGFLDQLDAFAASLIFEFNKLHASGQGLSGYGQMTSEHGIDQPGVPLDKAGLAFTPGHGSFQVEVVNKQTGVRTTHEVQVQLSGLEDDTTYERLIAALDAIDGLSAQSTFRGQLQLGTESADLVFALSEDSSGVLAALGLNTFFAGTGASTIGVQAALRQDPGKLAMSLGGVAHDTRNGERLAQMLTRPLDTRDGATLQGIYAQWMGETAQASSSAQAVAEGYRSFHTTLEGEHLGISGVSLDEEAVNMMTFQRSYQAAARVIRTISELLEVLVNL